MAKIPSTAQELFEQLTKAIKDDPLAAKDIGVKIGFNIDGAGEWRFDLADGQVANAQGCSTSGQCIVKMTHEDLKVFLADPSKGMGLYFDGRLKITGDINAASKIQHLMAMLKP